MIDRLCKCGANSWRKKGNFTGHAGQEFVCCACGFRTIKETASLQETAVSLYKAGGALKEIAYRLRTNPDYVRSLLKKAGVYEAQRITLTRKQFEAIKPRVVELYQGGLTMVDVARQLNISQFTVRRIVSGEKIKHGRRRFTTLAPEIEALYRAGTNKEAIARKLGISSTTVRNYLREKNGNG